ncbi:hypothetical protein uan_039 [Pseudomonas phage UAntarctica]|nr:hypothetical protein uan_039 [Pseudomonas phage UAntarctica]
MRTLTPSQVVDVGRKPVVARVVAKPRESKRAAKTQAFGDSLNTRQRTTAPSVPADVEIQKMLAVDMVNAFLDAQQLPTYPAPEHPVIKVAPGRNLFGPGALCDEALSYYIDMLAPYAVGTPRDTAVIPSPQLLPYLLGGIPMATVEQLAFRALELGGCYPVPEPGPTLLDSLCHVGFGERFPHIHSDIAHAVRLRRLPEESIEEYRAKLERHTTPAEPGPITKGLSNRQDYLYNLPTGETFAKQLLSSPPYRATMRRRVTKHKLAVIKDVCLLLQRETGEIPFMGAERLVAKCGTLSDYYRAIDITDAMFSSAVQRVFERPWKELDLTGDLVHDVEIMVARRLIYRLMGGARNSREPTRMSAQTLVGIALVTGISVVQWAKFAVQDGQRRGESFLDRAVIEEAIELIEMSELAPHFTCADHLAECCLQLDALNPSWSQRLRKPKRPFWSTRSHDYYVKAVLVTREAGEVFEEFTYRYPPEEME